MFDGDREGRGDFGCGEFDGDSDGREDFGVTGDFLDGFLGDFALFGFFDGDPVKILIGIAVGSTVGIAVGGTVGIAVGSTVGIAVGGIAVGSRDGSLDSADA